MPAADAMTPVLDRLIIALDLPSAADAQAAVMRIGANGRFYKVGLQLFTSAGPDFVRRLKDSGKKVFLDLKFHDIPNTAAGAVLSAAELGVDILTVHTSGGEKMLRAAVEAAASAGKPPLVLGVTVLTSLDDTDLAEIGLAARTMSEQVMRMAELARKCGCGGLVASPLEITTLRKAMGKDMKLVIPGVRPAGAEKGDQTRVATPSEAIAAGADFLVVGRPITAAADPAAAAKAIAAEMAGEAVSR
jgi:orotidine-5'-phosphate decarboxylase